MLDKTCIMQFRCVSRVAYLEVRDGITKNVKKGRKPGETAVVPSTPRALLSRRNSSALLDAATQITSRRFH